MARIWLTILFVKFYFQKDDVSELSIGSVTMKNICSHTHATKREWEVKSQLGETRMKRQPEVWKEKDDERGIAMRSRGQKDLDGVTNRRRQ